jgi:predicted phage-related endonuclease
MILINAAQGSNAWHEERNMPNTFTASEANALMGTSMYSTRTELLRQKKSGIVKDVSPNQQRLLDKGHAEEAMARPIAEEIVGQDFYPTVGYIEIDDMRLLASFDGITLDDETLFEHKLYNDALAASVADGIVPDSHLWQLEQQLLVSGANRVLFMVSDGTEGNCAWCYYTAQEGYAEKLIAAWRQFKSDLETFELEPEIIPAKAESVMALPALAIQVGGAISIQSNLSLFGDRLKSFIEETNAKPENDQDFANLEQACKVLKEAEDALKQAESNALAQTSGVDDMRRTVAYLADLARSNRLTFEKLVKSEKENRKAQIVADARNHLFEHHQRIQADLPVSFTHSVVNFADAIKGKKTLSSMQDAVSTMLANAKIEADTLARELREKHAWYVQTVVNEKDRTSYNFLFPDLAQLIYKPADDFKAVVSNRIAQHKEQERIKAALAAKAQAEREERIRKEAEAKAQREAVDREKQIAEEAARKERERIQTEQDAKEKLVSKDIKEVETIKEEPKQEPVFEGANDYYEYEEPTPTREKLIEAIAKVFWTTKQISEEWLVKEFSVNK